MKTFRLFFRCAAIAAALILALPAFGQKSLRFGVQAGYEFVNKEALSSASRLGFHAGVTLDANLPATPFGANLSVLYTYYGKQAKTGTYMLDKAYYLDVPLNIKYRIGLLGLRFVLFAGPYIRFNLEGGNINLQTISKTYQAHTYATGANFGAALALGNHITLGANYSTNLTDNYKEEDTGFEKVFSKRPDRVSVGITYFF